MYSRVTAPWLLTSLRSWLRAEWHLSAPSKKNHRRNKNKGIWIPGKSLSTPRKTGFLLSFISLSCPCFFHLMAITSRPEHLEQPLCRFIFHAYSSPKLNFSFTVQWAFNFIVDSITPRGTKEPGISNSLANLPKLLQVVVDSLPFNTIDVESSWTGTLKILLSLKETTYSNFIHSIHWFTPPTNI